MNILIGVAHAPQVLTRNNRDFVFVKEYKNFYLYKESNLGYFQCFCKSEFIDEMVKPSYAPKWNSRRHSNIF